MNKNSFLVGYDTTDFVFGKFQRLTKTSGLDFSLCILGSLLDYHSCMLDQGVLTVTFYPILIIAICQTKVYAIVVYHAIPVCLRDGLTVTTFDYSSVFRNLRINYRVYNVTVNLGYARQLETRYKWG